MCSSAAGPASARARALADRWLAKAPAEEIPASSDASKGASELERERSGAEVLRHEAGGMRALCALLLLRRVASQSGGSVETRLLSCYGADCDATTTFYMDAGSLSSEYH